MLIVGRCSFLVVCCLLFDGCLFLVVVDCSSFVACCFLSMFRC